MIDKKPFRVTNEQVDAEIICATSKGCSGCQREHEDCSQITETNIAAFLDLKDARELIDKQEAIIKEMREGINDMAVNPGGAFMLAKVTELLEKTKDYAE